MIPMTMMTIMVLKSRLLARPVYRPSRRNVRKCSSEPLSRVESHDIGQAFLLAWPGFAVLNCQRRVLLQKRNQWFHSFRSLKHDMFAAEFFRFSVAWLPKI